VLDPRALLADLSHLLDDVIAGLALELPWLAGAKNTHALPRHALAAHRTLPVFVFSLLGLPAGLLLAGADSAHPLYFAMPHAIVVLQTGQADAASHFFTNDGMLQVDCRNPTRAIVAGLAEEVAALAASPPSPLPPLLGQVGSLELLRRVGVGSARYLITCALLLCYYRCCYYRQVYSKNGLGYDYLWAHGRHPFGPFAAGPECSQLLLDAAARNAVLARLHSAYASALRSVEALRGLFLALLPAEQLRAALSALGLAGGAEQRLGIRALWALHPDGLATQKTKDAVAWLFAQLGELEARFAKVHGSIRALALADAGRAAGDALVAAQALEAFTQTEVARLEREL
jgi:hypothetical protein